MGFFFTVWLDKFSIETHDVLLEFQTVEILATHVVLTKMLVLGALIKIVIV